MRPKNQCQGCQAGWGLEEHKPWPKGSKPMYFHLVKGGYEGEKILCTKNQYEPDNEADMSNENQIRAKAVKDFVNLMIGALEAGFVDNNQPTLAEIHRVAQCHIKDTYGVESENIKDEWGEDVAKLCGLGATRVNG